MIDIDTLEKISRSITSQLPSGFDNLKEDVEKNIKSILQQQLSKLELVTREEFDTQNAVLLRTREKLEALEAAVRSLQ
ncbi:MAG: accessory factor UbiK family protein [Cycloclasticus sp.]|nr:accessory factor UbiK family protein [Cycloclasticus sp.]